MMGMVKCDDTSVFSSRGKQLDAGMDDFVMCYSGGGKQSLFISTFKHKLLALCGSRKKIPHPYPSPNGRGVRSKKELNP
jgi:hypothetical protein